MGYEHPNQQLLLKQISSGFWSTAANLVLLNLTDPAGNLWFPSSLSGRVLGGLCLSVQVCRQSLAFNGSNAIPVHTGAASTEGLVNILLAASSSALCSDAHTLNTKKTTECEVVFFFFLLLALCHGSSSSSAPMAQ